MFYDSICYNERREVMTILINILGAPSTGKSSLSSKLLAELKELECEAEYSPEYVKGWVWEGKKIGPFDQFYIFGKETHNQSMLFDKVDYVISDSPVMLTAFYHYYYDGRDTLKDVCKEFYKMAEEHGVTVLNFFLTRRKKYNPKGRYQTQEQADQLAKDLENWLTKEGYEYEVLDYPDEKRIERILEVLKGIKNAEAN